MSSFSVLGNEDLKRYLGALMKRNDWNSHCFGKPFLLFNVYFLQPRWKLINRTFDSQSNSSNITWLMNLWYKIEFDIFWYISKLCGELWHYQSNLFVYSQITEAMLRVHYRYIYSNFDTVKLKLFLMLTWNKLHRNVFVGYLLTFLQIVTYFSPSINGKKFTPAARSA